MSEALATAPWQEMGDKETSLGCPYAVHSAGAVSETVNNFSSTKVQAVFFNPKFLMNASAPLMTGIDFLNANEAGM